MPQCAAKTKEGTTCQVPALQGQRYCHVHRRQRLWRRIWSISAIGGVTLTILSIVADVTGVLGYFDVTSSRLPSPQITTNQLSFVATPYATATELGRSSTDSQTQPIWNKCLPPNLRDLIPAEGAISIVKTIYADMNSDGESEISVLSESKLENNSIVYLDIAVCNPSNRKWETATHKQFPYLPFEYAFDIEKIELEKMDGPLLLLVSYDIGAGSWGLDYWVFGFQNEKIIPLLNEQGIYDGAISTRQSSLVVSSVGDSWAYDWDGVQFQRIDTGFIPVENSVLVRYWWRNGQAFVEQQNITLKVGQILYLQRDRQRDDATVDIFKIQMSASEAFEWVDVVGATGIKANAPGENTIFIRPFNLDTQEVVVKVIALDSLSGQK
jgi:hypothetical protein